MNNGWTEISSETVQKLEEPPANYSVARATGMMAAQLCRLLYPKQSPADIGAEGIEVRWVRDALTDTVRVAYRVMPRVIERFGEPQAI